MVLTVGVGEVKCTCGELMRRTGGHFGGDGPSDETYYCGGCKKHVIVVTPNEEEQEEFAQRIA